MEVIINSKIKYRPGTPGDLRILLHLLEERSSFAGYVGYEEPALVRKIIARSYKAHRALFEHPEVFPLLIAEDPNTHEAIGYILLVLGMKESITNELQARIYDYYIKPLPYRSLIFKNFLEWAEKIAEEAKYRFIVADILAAQSEDERYFIERYFYVESNRILKRVGRYIFSLARQKMFYVRPAKESDRMFILLLNAQNSPFLVPAGREDDLEKIRASYFDLYSTINISSDPYLLTLIAEDVTNQRPAGFIMINLRAVDAVSAKQIAYIYDINVHRDYWGKYVAQRLVKEAENRLMDMQIPYIVGDTSETNPRPLQTALRTLKFKIFSRRWAKRIS